ncbi:hypothetical protein Rsub_02887 [Raphidocelis subcapitata]|uniref:Uncharacterized protein n=1 Tax=Raphidocelis subcapitata TaxID=307507 RepID=A0A2V0NXR6_9CHLO|nr:hypothetical protein Rsub_02887 [Raphidocelis subcapitata]|eukprot:GBF89717.1 hypothetical protein Rsub_02887 [Raphidocelis subcapitata]
MATLLAIFHRSTGVPPRQTRLDASRAAAMANRSFLLSLLLVLLAVSSASASGRMLRGIGKGFPAAGAAYYQPTYAATYAQPAYYAQPTYYAQPMYTQPVYYQSAPVYSSGIAYGGYAQPVYGGYAGGGKGGLFGR